MTEIRGLTNLPAPNIGTLNVSQDLTVVGSGVSALSDNLYIEQNTVTINPANEFSQAGILISSDGTPVATLYWNAAAGKWKVGSQAGIRNILSVGDIAALLPDLTGTIVAYGGTGIPTGWLRCDGQTVSSGTYSKLYSKIGETYNDGSEPAGDFRLPDYSGRAVRGMYSAGYTTVGAKGGTNLYHNHTADHSAHSIPAHTHSIPSHNHNMATHAHNFPAHFHDDTGGLSVSSQSHYHMHLIGSSDYENGPTPGWYVPQTAAFVDEVRVCKKEPPYDAWGFRTTSNDHNHAPAGCYGYTSSSFNGDTSTPTSSGAVIVASGSDLSSSSQISATLTGSLGNTADSYLPFLGVQYIIKY